jgi:hypothetical protein
MVAGVRPLLLLLVVSFALAVPVSANAAAARPGCRSVHLSWGVRCIAAGQFCKVSADAQYHRYGFHCHTGRLSRSAAGKRRPAPGCEPGYSPCLPRVADLNCSDIPASKKPVRVTGSDPYRLDGNHDGWGCTS